MKIRALISRQKNLRDWQNGKYGQLGIEVRQCMGREGKFDWRRVKKAEGMRSQMKNAAQLFQRVVDEA